MGSDYDINPRLKPITRSVRMLEEAGWLVGRVEYRMGVVAKDLFGMFDLLAIRAGEVLAVQVTSASNMSARERKITKCPALAEVRQCAWRVELHGWRQAPREDRWVVRVVDLS